MHLACGSDDNGILMESLNIIHSVLSWLGQTETWLHSQIVNLPDTITSHVVCEQTENLDQFPIGRLHCLADASWSRRYWADRVAKRGIRKHTWFLAKVARNASGRILHSHFGNRGWADMEVAARRTMKHVVTFYGYDVNYLPLSAPVWRERYEELFESVDQVLCEGSHMARCIVALGCPEGKVTVHHLGIDLACIPYRPRMWDPSTPLRVLIAGSFREKKGIPYALEALGNLHQRCTLEITVIGDASAAAVGSQEEKQKILDVIARQGMEGYTRLIGFQPHHRLLEEAYVHHIFVSPSVTAVNGDTEGGVPVSIIEMAASGMPVVSTTHCDIPEVLQGGMMSLLAP